MKPRKNGRALNCAIGLTLAKKKVACPVCGETIKKGDLYLRGLRGHAAQFHTCIACLGRITARERFTGKDIRYTFGPAPKDNRICRGCHRPIRRGEYAPYKNAYQTCYSACIDCCEDTMEAFQKYMALEDSPEEALRYLHNKHHPALEVKARQVLGAA